MSVSRSLLILLVLVVALPLYFFGQANQPTTDDDTIRLQDLQLYEVRTGSVALSVSAVGSVQADEVLALSLLVPGRVAEVFVNLNDYILAGDDLLRLENDPQRIAYQQALIAVERARLAYEDLLTIDDSAIQVAEAAVAAAEGAYYSAVTAISQADVQAAEIAYQQALEAADTLRVERDRIGGQFGGDSTAWEQANARYGEATFQAEIARLQAQRLRNSGGPQARAALTGIAQARAELERVLAGATTVQLDSSAIGIEQAESQLERAQVSFERTRLTTPITGVVTALNVEEGALVAPGLTVVEVTDIDPLSLTVQVDEIDIGLVQVGQSVRVTLDALPDLTLPATVTRIAPLGTPSGGIVSYAVEIALDGLDPRVRVGMTAEATIIIEETDDVLVVPNLYIRRDRETGRGFVNVLRPDNTVEEVEVEIGISGRESSAIISGLAEGDLVAIDLGGGGLNILEGGP